MSVSLSAERDRIQRQVEELEQSLSATHAELELLSSETGDESDGDDSEEEGQSAAGLLAQREKIQKEIQSLENVLGPHSPVCVSDDDSSSSSEESELGLSPSVDTCLQMNLVYQQVVQETLDQLETLLTHNQREQEELVSQLSGPIKDPSRRRPAPSSCQQPINMYLGRFLKPYFKDKLTGLGPPANQETKEKSSRMTGCPDDRKLNVKRWESWQKTLLLHSVSRDALRRLVQPKLSRVDYLSQKLSSAAETDRQQLQQQIDSLETEIDLLRKKKEHELIGERFDEHDWQKISNVDFEGTREAEDIRCFWQNFLHPSINKSRWSQEEVQQLKEVSRRHRETHWEDIAAELGTGRTAFLCLQTFQRFVSESLKRGGWTASEDDQLRELVDKMRIGNFIPYTQMSYFMDGRDPAQLIYRWNQVLDPSLKRGFWTKEEDQLLLQAVSRHGERDWWKIRFEVPGRTDSGCRDRYYDCLKAETKRGPFDEQEKELLLLLVEKHGVGRWARIAAEIPHRYDAQCLREWRRLNRPPPAQKDKKPKKPPRSRGGQKQERKKGAARRRTRKRLIKVKEESSGEEEMEVQYMDSDEEKSMKKDAVEQEQQEVQEEQEEQEEKPYPLLPLQQWIPAPTLRVPFSFRLVQLCPSGAAQSAAQSAVQSAAQSAVRSTVLARCGRSVMAGPPPQEVAWEERHSSSTMMMVSADQLRAYLLHLKSSRSSRDPAGRALSRDLQAAVTPWIGNLLIPLKQRVTVADALRERGERAALPSTPFFQLLLQAMSVDAVGCKEMIEQRRSKVASLAPPPSRPPAPPRATTVAGMLHLKEAMKDGLLLQNKPILAQSPSPFAPAALSPPAASPRPPASLNTPPPAASSRPPSSLNTPPPGVLSVSAALRQPAAALTSSPHWQSESDVSQSDVELDRTGGAGTGGAGTGGAGTGVDVSDGVITGRRIRKPSQKAKALQEATKAKVKAKKKSASTPQRRDQVPAPPQVPVSPQGPAPPQVPAPPQGPAPPQLVVAVPVQLVPQAGGSSPLPGVPSFPNDHNYTCSSPAPSAPNKCPKAQPRGRKRGRGEEPAGVSSSQNGERPSGTGAGRPPQKKRSRPSRPQTEEVLAKQPAQPVGFCLLPNQQLFVLSPGGLVQLTPPPAPDAPPPAPPGGANGRPAAAISLPSVPAELLPAAAPPSSLPGSSHMTPRLFLPFTGPAAPPALRMEALQFDPSVMFLESGRAVSDWLSGRGGVAVPGARVALPYLPPFVSSLSTLSALLRAKKSLAKSSLQLLSRGSEPRRRPARPGPHSRAEGGTTQPHLPDSTSDPTPAPETPAPSGGPEEEEEQEEQEEAELVAVVRQLVAERFSTNPAYQLLKARFLSSFTVPALLATMQPIREQTVADPATKEEEKEEEEEEEEEEVKPVAERRRRTDKSVLCESGAPANQDAGTNTNTRTGLDRTRPDRTGPAGTGLTASSESQSSFC